MNHDKKNVGRPPSKIKIKIEPLNIIANGYAEAARMVKGNRGCVYLCCCHGSDRKKHKGYSFSIVQ